MSDQYPEEIQHLHSTIELIKLSHEKNGNRLNQYEKEYRASKRYLAEYRNEIDSMEIFSNERSQNQIENLEISTAKLLNRLERLMNSPYFSRIDFCYSGEDQPEKVYIGSHSFHNKGEILVYDWRAPISSMYYDYEHGSASFISPTGTVTGKITLKRQYKIENGELHYVLESALSIGDDILQQELSQASDERMKNIIATIQKEQNQIIRNEKSHTLIIQGAAGSGKTSVALHRAAYLLYRNRDQLSADNIAIISPNKVFADYISNVLPELGEEPITELSFYDIASAELGSDILLHPVYTQEDYSSEGHRKRARFKSSLKFLALLNRYIQQLDKQKSAFKDTWEAYLDFFRYIERPDILSCQNKNDMEWEDAFAFLYLKYHLEGLDDYRTVLHLIIDEMQDYTPVQYALLEKIFPCKKTILGDFGQSVNPANGNTLESLSQILKRSEVLKMTKSYRCTYEIIHFAERIRGIHEIDAMKRHGKQPKVIACPDKEGQLAEIKKLITNFYQKDYSSMGIILRTIEQAKAIYHFLSGYPDVHLLTTESDTFHSGIMVMNVYTAKGLEFDEVVLPFTDRVAYQTEHDRSLLYIACTRAMHELTLTYYGTGSRYLPNE